MKSRQIDLPLSGHGHAVLSIPTPVTPERLRALEQSLTCALARLRRSLSVEALDPGLIEYASWLPQRRQ